MPGLGTTEIHEAHIKYIRRRHTEEVVELTAKHIKELETVRQVYETKICEYKKRLSEYEQGAPAASSSLVHISPCRGAPPSADHIHSLIRLDTSSTHNAPLLSPLRGPTNCQDAATMTTPSFPDANSR